MPTPIDRAVSGQASRNAVLGFAGVITAVAAWTIWGGSGSSMFPSEEDPKGEPETWSHNALKRWLNKRNLFPGDSATKEELVARVRANMRAPRV